MKLSLFFSSVLSNLYNTDRDAYAFFRGVCRKRPATHPMRKAIALHESDLVRKADEAAEMAEGICAIPARF